MANKNLLKNAVNLSKLFCIEKLHEGDIAVDATMGNGNDTLFLCQLVGSKGKVYAFDVQETAIAATKEKLLQHNYLESSVLILDSHANMKEYLKDKVIKLVLFNLGYLPGGNHAITTKTEATIKAIEAALSLITENGIVIIVIYPGHAEGMEEKIAIENLVSHLNQKEYNVAKLNFLNQINNPPILIYIEKI